MTGSRISNTVTRTVFLDTKHHASPLTVTPTGVIDVTQTYGAAGIMGAQAGDEVLNHGSVTAARGVALHADHARRRRRGGHRPDRKRHDRQ